MSSLAFCCIFLISAKCGSLYCVLLLFLLMLVSPLPALTVSATPHTKATCVGNGIDQQQVK